jgi:hypothetical protein
MPQEPLERPGSHRSKRRAFAGRLAEPSDNSGSGRCGGKPRQQRLAKGALPGIHKSSEPFLCTSWRPPKAFPR